MSPSLIWHTRTYLALRLAYRPALAGPRHEQRKHMAHTSEHRDVPLLSPDTIAERIGYTRNALTRASRTHHRRLTQSLLTLDVTLATCTD